MKTAKSCKLVLILTALIMFLTAFSLMGINSARADDSVTAVSGSGIFEYTNISSVQTIETDGNGNMNIPVNDGASFKIKRPLVVNDFEIGLILTEITKKLTLTFESEANDVNSEKVNNVLVLNLNNGTITAEYNGASSVTVKSNYNYSDVLAIRTQVVNGLLKITVNGIALDPLNNYQIEAVDKSIADISFDVDLVDANEGEDAPLSNVKVRYIGQKASASQTINGELVGDYLQTFIVDADGKIGSALPRLEIDDNVINNGKVIRGMNYSIDLSSSDIYYVYNAYSNSNITLSVKEGTDCYLTESAKKVSFLSITDDCEFYLKDTDGKVIETYNVEVVDSSIDTNAPTYNFNATAKANFIDKLNESLISSKEGGKIVYVPIGSGCTLTLPSLKALVSDDLTAYGNLSGTLNYCLPNATTYTSVDFSSTNSKLTIPLTKSGQYKFYLMFEDVQGNAMEIDDFYTVSDTDENAIVEGKYYEYIFTFNILDNHPISVSAPSENKSGYLNTRFTAPSFDIVGGENPTTTYALYFCSTKSENQSDWVEIPTSTSVSEDYNENGFTYEDLKEISYNGELSFTPDRIGYYKITCTIESSNSFSDEATVFVNISEKPVYVKPDSNWLENNVWSIVFLSVGTLCLAGIIALLCIKPKDKNNDD